LTVCVVATLVLIAFDWLVVRDHTGTNPGSVGLLAGLALGGWWTQRRGRFTGRGSMLQRTGRLAVGLLTGLPLIAVMQRFGVPESELGTRLVVALDLTLFGLYLTAGAPWLFENLRLVEPVSEP
jgi:hypothetical protein